MCLYGYSFSCFVIIFLLCIIPLKGLQWFFIAYGMVNTTVFLILNLRTYLEDVDNAKQYLTFGIIRNYYKSKFDEDGHRIDMHDDTDNEAK